MAQQSAAHWCKAVIDEVAPQVTTIPPPPPPPIFKLPVQSNQSINSTASTNITNPSLQASATLSPYEKYYTQYYNSMITPL
jgi:hypothetical protein